VTAGFFFRTLIRESRGSRGRLLFFVACLSVGVAAVVAVAGLSASLDDGIRSEARQLLAADLAIESRRPIPKDLNLATAGLAGAERTDLQETVTVVAAPSRAAGEPGPPSSSPAWACARATTCGSADSRSASPASCFPSRTGSASR
jgi:predicted lysophospholipase L1 biosynthesis ABC-type transport system permease subunit